MTFRGTWAASSGTYYVRHGDDVEQIVCKEQAEAMERGLDERLGSTFLPQAFAA